MTRILRHNRIVTEYTPKRPRGPGFARVPTDTGTRILAAIRVAERRGVVPSVRELVATCKLSSTSVALYHLRQLARDGDLVLGARGTSRSYRLTDQGRGYPSDEEMLRRCLDYFERELSAVGRLVDDLKQRLEQDDEQL